MKARPEPGGILDALTGFRRIRPAVLGALLVSAAPLARAQATPAAGLEKAGYVEGSVGPLLLRARRLAIEKLGSARCRQLFTEFEDAAGRRLEVVLQHRRETGAHHLLLLSFRDGSSTAACRTPIFAFTDLGSQEVFLCPPFMETVRRDAATAANILIHEMLHSLGAGEAPAPGLPTSLEITARVALLCGR